MPLDNLSLTCLEQKSTKSVGSPAVKGVVRLRWSAEDATEAVGLLRTDGRRIRRPVPFSLAGAASYKDLRANTFLGTPYACSRRTVEYAG